MLFEASAPGSLMLLGEHAVLHGNNAVVLAVNYRMHVTLSPRTDNKVTIQSVLGNFSADLSTLQVESPFEFILTIVKHYQTQLPSGFDLQVQADFSHQIGFASSAAVTVATLRVIHAWLNILVTNDSLIWEARNIVREVQGMGSGADVAAAVLGGVVAYQAEPFFAQKIAYQYPITVIYSGGKTKTAEVIRYVDYHFKETKEIYQKIIRDISVCATDGIAALKNHDHVSLGKIMDQQQVCMDALKINSATLQTVIAALKQDKNILGSKISGAGLGDCAIGLGEAEQLNLPENLRRYVCQIDTRGVQLEKN